LDFLKLIFINDTIFLSLMTTKSPIKKIILAAILGIFATFTLSFGRCLPAGCSFTDATCSVNSACANNCCTSETLMQHLDEKNSFLIALAGTGMLGLFLLLVLLAVAWHLKLGAEPIELAFSCRRLAGYSQPPPFCYLEMLFSDGILKPKNH